MSILRRNVAKSGTIHCPKNLANPAIAALISLSDELKEEIRREAELMNGKLLDVAIAADRRTAELVRFILTTMLVVVAAAGSTLISNVFLSIVLMVYGCALFVAVMIAKKAFDPQDHTLPGNLPSGWVRFALEGRDEGLAIIEQLDCLQTTIGLNKAGNEKNAEFVRRATFIYVWSSAAAAVAAAACVLAKEWMRLPF